jgi:hypothetical protein
MNGFVLQIGDARRINGRIHYDDGPPGSAGRAVRKMKRGV